MKKLWRKIDWALGWTLAIMLVVVLIIPYVIATHRWEKKKREKREPSPVHE